jgi:CopA family copper-resistance protein
MQEQVGVYGPIVIDPRDADRVAFEREHTVLLSDWTDEDPMRVFDRLKKKSHYYNYERRTLADIRAEIAAKGRAAVRAERAMWNRTRMNDRDIADVTGSTYTYLMNGQPPAADWKALFRRGDRVRLRLINGSAMTIFDLQSPGLNLTVVAADGQDVEPVTVRELRIGVAETYDVIVRPSDDSAYSIFAQAIDRSGYARGSLTPDFGMSADPPPLDMPPQLSMIDMGMAGSMAGMNEGAAAGGAMDHGAMAHGSVQLQNAAPQHAPSEFGPGTDMRASNPQLRLDDPGVGLRDRAWPVLTYASLQSIDQQHGGHGYDREIELHLTGNMQRYMWSFNGLGFSRADRIDLKLGERVRFVLVNDTMMNHPIHLHGLWSDIETEPDGRYLRKHTVNVQPGQRLAYGVMADAPGPWAYHCHLLYHMEAGMFRVVQVG